MIDWKSRAVVPPPRSGEHILVCCGPYSPTWRFAQRPPAVVHYWSNPGEEGFYLSNGNDNVPFHFTHWAAMDGEEPET